MKETVPRGRRTHSAAHASLAFRARLGPLVLGLALAVGSAEGAIFAVNSTSDVGDATINGVCETAPGNAVCTLRAAIQEANAVAGPHTIDFAIPGPGPHIISVSAAGLPTIVTQQTIDGYSQPGASANTLAVGNNAVLRIELDGTATVAGVSGLRISAINSTVQGLVVNRFADNGIWVDATGAVIRGNFVGTDVTGTLARSNNRDGVLNEAGILLTSGGATIGGTLPSARNLVSGNDVNCPRGIEIFDSSGNTIQGNYVGTNAAGTAPIGNRCAGIALDGNPGVGSDNNLIGGAVAGAGNLISGGMSMGIFLTVDSNTNTIQGNRIGVNADGTAPLPNAAQGIRILTSGNIVGGDTLAKGNVISGNTLAGIVVEGEAADGNVIEGNYIGTDVTGTLDRGNSQTGITVFGGADNTRIGGSALLGIGNVISGNSFEGIYVFDVSTTGTIVQGNRIGTNAAGTAGIGNGYAGFATDTSATGTQVGGINPGEGNTIAFNVFPGVGLAGASTTATIVGNSIHSNGQLGIDLGYDGLVTANDVGDGDAGPNALLNFPMITAASPNGASLNVSFSLDVPAGSYRIEFFRNPTGVDPSGYGEGEVFAGTTNVTHPGGGSSPPPSRVPVATSSPPPPASAATGRSAPPSPGPRSSAR